MIERSSRKMRSSPHPLPGKLFICGGRLLRVLERWWSSEDHPVPWKLDFQKPKSSQNMIPAVQQRSGANYPWIKTTRKVLNFFYHSFNLSKESPKIGFSCQEQLAVCFEQFPLYWRGNCSRELGIFIEYVFRLLKFLDSF